MTDRLTEIRTRILCVLGESGSATLPELEAELARPPLQATRYEVLQALASNVSLAFIAERRTYELTHDGRTVVKQETGRTWVA